MSWTGARGQENIRPSSFVDIAGIKHTLVPSKDKATVLFFMVQDCPIANYYSWEINAIVKDNAGKGIRFFVVHVDPELTPEAARDHAKEYGLKCPILMDAKHELVKATGATITPEAAVLTPDGKVAYLGRIDDRYVDLGKRRIEPNRRDVREALSAILAGQPIKEPRTQAIGCPIPK